ncbi:MAG: T9SS type A sorting domain-containing protein [candidate division KSB1 bacterium]|nr:T9SS type A sorting domain-containing protein [candidate division KSB1 bacterium]MDZ7386190.1 T9SS type A sorting domain-containing protein [candidate division KSB1 bacterium]MDZ7392419.1 T9SS type A sorting domain-containing protein [candidate division KSB1 bacterium]MDZ7412264.1 T9SS type A sorting domain-containing protein [candidate division KSB1 bacterium]
MRGSRVLAALVAAVLALPAGLVAQDELIIPPTDGSTFLNKQIEDDVSRPPGRVYVLKRDGFYLFNGVLTNNGWVLRIRAEEGTGQKPVIYLIADAATGVFPSHFIEMGEDVYLKDIVLVGFIESMEGQIANNPPRLIRSRAAGFDLVIDGCIITQSRGEHIRLEQATRLVKITNCIFANMGDLGTSNLGAGKPIDFRNASCDSAIFINNTFVNFHDRVVRHRASVAAINHFIFDHNTVVNSLGYHGTLVLGWLGKECRITNNLFVDHFIAGADTDRTRQAEFEEPGELDPRNGLGRMAWVLSVPNDTTHWVVTGNYYAVSPEVQAFYDRHAAEGLLGEGPALTHHICSRLGADSSNAFVKEDIVLANRPRPMVNMAEWYRNPNGGNKTKNTPSDKWNRATDDYDRRPWQYFADTLDCSYPTSTAAYTGALGGFPAGDLNWFPAKKAEWEVWVTSVERRQAAPLEFALYQNYPNPFNPCTTIRFNISRPEFVTLKIYDMLGRLVATPLAQRVGAGQHVISFDGSQLPSGVYLYAIQAGRHEAFRKMVLMK